MNSILFFSGNMVYRCKNMKPNMADFGDIVSYVDVDEDKENNKAVERWCRYQLSLF